MIHVLPGHERAVVFTLGRVAGVKGPGLVILVPILQTMKRVDLRPIVARSRNAALTYHVVDPARALLAVASYQSAMETLLDTVFRKVMEGRGADALTFERDGIRAAIEGAVKAACGEWGLAVDKVEVNR